jgi:phage shock protein PspC (stress-responsive transcriptional regulator)
MNKTLDINIANQIFHIDENAYAILKNYLDAIKKSLANEASRDEIIQDIEARIAELFIERMISDKQVISVQDVNAVINIMGQPEDYHISDEDEPAERSTYRTDKKLYRDKDSAYISGVAAGLAHYLNIDPVWVRFLWIIFTIFSAGWAILFYIIFWIIVPEAKTTAEKLAMKGEPINLSNIEKKIKEGYENVSEKIKDVDVEKHSRNAQDAISKFFSGLEVVLRKLGSVLIKAFGIILFIASGLGLISLIVSTLGISGLGFFSNIGFLDYDTLRFENVVDSILPTWAIITTAFVFVSVPLVLLFILSLRILFSNIKKISMAVIIPLLSLWVISIVAFVIMGLSVKVKERTAGEIVTSNEISTALNDTIYIKMRGNLNYTSSPFKQNLEKITYDGNRRILYDSNVDIKINQTSDNRAYARVSRFAYDYGEENAREKANEITYEFELNSNELIFDTYMIGSPELRNNSIGVDVDLYLPDGKIFHLDKNVEDFLENRFENDTVEAPFTKLYILENKRLKCISCK